MRRYAKGSPEAAAAAIQNARRQPASGDRRAFQQEPEGPDRRAAQPVPDPREDAADRSLIELLRSELKEMRDSAGQPAQAMKDLKDEIKAMMESAAARTAAAAAAAASSSTSGSRQMEAKSFPRSAVSPATAWIPNPEFQALQESLVDMEVEPALAAEAVGAAYGEFRIAYKQEAPAETLANEPGEREAALLTRNLAERIRVTGGIRLRPGRPTTVALVGPTGVGKTTTLAKLAALAKIQQGKKVGIISADSFRMGANEQLELFGRTAGIPVKPVFSPADVAQAQREFADLRSDPGGHRRPQPHPQGNVARTAGTAPLPGSRRDPSRAFRPHPHARTLAPIRLVPRPGRGAASSSPSWTNACPWDACTTWPARPRPPSPTCATARSSRTISCSRAPTPWLRPSPTRPARPSPVRGFPGNAPFTHEKPQNRARGAA